MRVAGSEERVRDNALLTHPSLVSHRATEIVEHPDFFPNPIATFVRDLAEIFTLRRVVEKTQLSIHAIQLLLR